MKSMTPFRKKEPFFRKLRRKFTRGEKPAPPQNSNGETKRMEQPLKDLKIANSTDSQNSAAASESVFSQESARKSDSLTDFKASPNVSKNSLPGSEICTLSETEAASRINQAHGQSQTGTTMKTGGTQFQIRADGATKIDHVQASESDYDDVVADTKTGRVDVDEPQKLETKAEKFASKVIQEALKCDPSFAGKTALKNATEKEHDIERILGPAVAKWHIDFKPKNPNQKSERYEIRLHPKGQTTPSETLPSGIVIFPSGTASRSGGPGRNGSSSSRPSWTVKSRKK
ncbi:hypothetical protein E2P81_ATG03728 [Venturia nashicola]|uniref:Uncharacterized protein n=1 Tax=Venturia nashicola TaxID=86259 RepID=A0A4Z1PEM6_9PEZI|nr:hypothetical protein E6O75_ATG03812 [Venturia nashicola]TLD38053.1 hypothetical protein E2P81_ATG03728 [Venturia nashicola]